MWVRYHFGMAFTLTYGFSQFAARVRVDIYKKHGFMVNSSFTQSYQDLSCYFGAKENDGSRWILFRSAQPVSMDEAADAVVNAPLESWRTGPAEDDGAIEYVPQATTLRAA
jgi:hypothetical protein